MSVGIGEAGGSVGTGGAGGAGRSGFGPQDEAFAREALALASRGAGRVAPNPLVGAVIVSNGEIVGRGFHVFAERDHAEIVALRQAGERARGATLYVTLEPCSTEGRTPPCVAAIRSAGIARVVACHADPNPKHAGEGLRALRGAGAAVSVGLLREEAARLNERWLHRLDTDRSHVSVKLATSSDGRIASSSGESRWVTGEPARRRVQEMRRFADAVLVGVGTVLADDPRLTLRASERVPDGSAFEAPGPWRCVLDPSLRTPPGARILQAPPDGELARGTMLVTSASARGPERAEREAALRDAGAEIVEVRSWSADGSYLAAPEIAAALAEAGIDGLLVEGGGLAAGTWLSSPDAQLLVLHVAPIVLGDVGTRPAVAGFGAVGMDDARRFRRRHVLELGDDLEIALEPRLGWSMDVMLEDLVALEQRLEA